MAQVLALQSLSVRDYAMKAIPTDGELRQLLLRQLPAEAMEDIEDRLVLDDSIAERLQHQQYDLLDDYARGRLAQDERRAVEKYLLRTPAERDRIYVVEGLMRAAQQRKGSGSNVLRGLRASVFRPANRPVFAAALTVGLAIVIVLAVRVMYPSTPRGGEVQPATQSGAVGFPAAPLSPSTPANALYQLTLLADATRSGGVVELSLPRGVAGEPPRFSWRLVGVSHAAMARPGICE
jgi:hypothetical protein